MEQEKALAVFEGKNIRRIWHNEEWWFSIFDIIEILTGSSDPKQYIKKMRQRDLALDSNWGTICTPLELTALDGKKREVNCVNTEGAFRIIQSIPSPKAEPFKLWLAKVGYERVQEIENPELAQKRMKEIYKQKGYSDEWIEKRVRGIAIRDELTDEWKKRDVKTEKEYAILTSEISKATFGMTPSEYKEFKGLKKENLRDHMDDLELIFNMLGEASTTKIARGKDAQGFPENKDAAKKGGKIAGDARRNLEIESGSNVVTPENYLDEPESQKRKRLKDSSNIRKKEK
ncbi:MAG: Bro-N domain-containing protein [Candidatus Woesearchaeota archaeon]|nr:Bro-N domain-containing protein [Candidatus Woesearchaeota archaeon]